MMMEPVTTAAPAIMVIAPALHIPVPSSSSLQRARIGRPEGLTPLPNRLVSHRDAALGKHIFNISEAHAESMVESHRVTNDFGRKPVSVVAGHVAVHRFTLPPAPQLDNASIAAITHASHQFAVRDSGGPVGGARTRGPLGLAAPQISTQFGAACFPLLDFCRSVSESPPCAMASASRCSSVPSRSSS